jgi:hypothetical protein
MFFKVPLQFWYLAFALGTTSTMFLLPFEILAAWVLLQVFWVRRNVIRLKAHSF